MTDGLTVGFAGVRADPLTGSLVDAVAAAAADVGLVVRSVDTPADEASVDVLLSIGLPRLHDRLLAAPRRVRRIAWFGEPLPRPEGRARPSFVSRRVLGPALRAARGPARPLRSVGLPARLDAFRAAAYVEHERQSNLAAALRRAATVDLVVVSSRDRARVLAEHGVSVRVVPFGYHPVFGGPLTPADSVGRDLDAVVLGSGLDWGSRRARLVRSCVGALEPSASVLVTGPTWGLQRDALLRRARVMLDVHRVPGNFIGLRLILASAAGAVLVTEPMDDPHPFEPGTHYVEAPVESLADATREILGDERRRGRIVETAQAFLAGELSMATSLRAVLA